MYHNHFICDVFPSIMSVKETPDDCSLERSKGLDKAMTFSDTSKYALNSFMLPKVCANVSHTCSLFTCNKHLVKFKLNNKKCTTWGS